jgi:hypothetical protein
MMPSNEIAAIESSNMRQRAEAHGARSHARWFSGRFAPHGLSSPMIAGRPVVELLALREVGPRRVL